MAHLRTIRLLKSYCSTYILLLIQEFDTEYESRLVLVEQFNELFSIFDI